MKWFVEVNVYTAVPDVLAILFRRLCDDGKSVVSVCEDTEDFGVATVMGTVVLRLPEFC